MARMRALIRTVAFLLATLGSYALWLLGVPVARQHRYTAIRWRNYCFRLWARLCRAILNMQLTVEGEPPREPFLLVSNHLSYIDVIAIGSQTECTFVAKSDIEHWPLLGYMGGKMETIFIDRTSASDLPHVIGLIEHALHERKGVVVFAEGTSSPGSTVMPFLPSLLEPAVRQNLPVAYATITYRIPSGTPPVHTTVCWWGGMSFRKHLFNLFHVPSFEATLRFGPQRLHEENRKVLARKLQQAVLDQFEPVVSPDEVGEWSLTDVLERARGTASQRDTRPSRGV